MVDVRQADRHFVRSPTEHRALTHSAAGISVETFGDEALSRYAAFCAQADVVHGPHQDPVWLSAWAKETGAEMVALRVDGVGQPQFVLVLEIVRRGPFHIARFPGGPHASGNFPVATRSFLASEGAMSAIEALPPALRAVRPAIDLLSLERLQPTKDGFNNPMLAIATGKSPDAALAVDLSGGFDAVLARTPGKHKQRRHNSQGRKLEAAGGYRLVSARTPEAVETLLSAFFTMKAERFRRMGIRNVFAGREVQAFFRRLYREALDSPSPRFVLHGLEVGGELRAVTGSSVLGDRMTCDFSSISENGIASASPGDFLFFEDIKEACQNGLRVFDFSVGEQPYKRLWCNIEIHQQDAFLPLSGKGRAMMLARRRLGAAKRALKKRPAIWAIVKRLQRVVVRGSRTASETRDD